MGALLEGNLFANGLVGPKPTVLVIDDSSFLLELVSTVLESANINVIEHNKPVGVGRLIIKHQPEVVLLDVKMPIIDGIDLMKMIRENPSTANTKILLHSAMDPIELAGVAKSTGADGYIPKESNGSNIVHAIRSHLGSQWDEWANQLPPE